MTRRGYGRLVVLALLAIVAVVQPLVFVPAASAATTAQESPYLQPTNLPGGPETPAFFQPLEGLPVWAQAALFSAAVVGVMFLLFEASRFVWDRVRHAIYTRE